MALLKTNTGIGTTNPTSALHVIGDGLLTGVVTATTFNGDINSNTSSLGNASASQLNVSGVSTFNGAITGTISTATKLETARTFEITGDIVASPITFDGTGNVSLAATIQPNSVGLGTDTFGDYVRDISGTANEITVTGGTGEGSTPVISFAPNPLIGGNVTIGNDLQVNNNLNINGNITVGGTAGYILVNEFRVSDADIILGFTTDISGNDVSNDTTANHGGIAVASTEGTPLVNLNIAGIETLPPTYKKIMWFKAGSFAGLNTDAWLSNYAIGIGSTQFPSGTRLAAGSVQFTENDLAVVRNINASGIVTGSTFRPSSGYIQSPNGTNAFYIYDGTGNVAFQGTIGASQINNASGFKVIGFAGTNITFENDARIGNNAYIAGVTTSVGGFLGNLTGTATTATNLSDAANITTGTINAARLTGTYNIDISGNAATADYADLAGIATYATTTGVATYADAAGFSTFSGYASNAGIATYASNAGIATYASNAGIATYASNAGVATNVSGGTASVTQLSVSGVSTLGVVTAGNIFSTGIITALTFVGNLTGTATTASFATTAFNLNGTAEGDLNVAFAQTAGIATFATFATNAGIATNLKGGVAGNVPYQSATDTTTFVPNGSSGQVLLFNGSIPIWSNVSSASGAFGGITVYDEGNLVGTAGSIATLNFVSPNLVVTGTSGANGIATVTMSDNLVGTAISISGISTFSDNVTIGSGITMYASTGIVSATAFYGSGLNLTDLINQRIEGLQIQNEGSNVGTGFTYATLNFIGDYVTATGVGTVANITFTTPPYALVAGIATYANLSGVATYASNAGIATYANLAGVSTNVIGGIASVTSLNVSGISTLGGVRISSGIITATSGVVTYYGDGSQLQGVTAFYVATQVNTSEAVYPTLASGVGVNSVGISTTKLVFVESTSSLGIGTTNPRANLHVVDEFLVAAGSATTQHITQKAYELEGGALSWEGTAGQLFSITNNLTSGSIFSVNDVSGIPSIDVDADGTIQLTPYADGNVGIATTNPTSRLHVVGDVLVTGVVTATTFSGNATSATYASTAGIATFATTAGIATYASTAGIATYASNAGISTYASTAGIATYASNAGISTYALVAGIATYASNAGVATNVSGGTASVTSINVDSAVSITAETSSGSNDVIYFNPLNESRVSIGINTTLNWSSLSNIPDVAFVADKTIFGYPKIAIANPTQSSPFYQLRAAYSNASAPYGYVRQDIDNGSYAIALDNAATAFSVGDRTSLDSTRTSNFSSGNEAFVVTLNGSTSLFHSKSKKFETSGVGVTVYGNLNVGTGGTVITTTASGLVGIGTTNPTSKLHVVGSTLVTGISTIGNFHITPVGTGATVGGIGVTYYGDGSQLSGISAGLSITDDTSTNATRYILFDDATSGTITGANVSSTKLTFNPSTGNLVAGGTVTANSDERLKENVKTIENALDKVLSLRGVEFDRIDTGDHQIGVIAQEVEKIVPDVVYPKQPAPDYETKSVAYANLVGLLIEAVKEQNRRIDELERRLEGN